LHCSSYTSKTKQKYSTNLQQQILLPPLLRKDGYFGDFFSCFSVPLYITVSKNSLHTVTLMSYLILDETLSQAFWPILWLYCCPFWSPVPPRAKLVGTAYTMVVPFPGRKLATSASGDTCIWRGLLLLPSMHWNWLLTVTFSSMLRNL